MSKSLINSICIIFFCVVIFSSCNQKPQEQVSQTMVDDAKEIKKAVEKPLDNKLKVMMTDASKIDLDKLKADISNFDQNFANSLPVANIPFGIEPSESHGLEIVDIVGNVGDRQFVGKMIQIGHEEAFFNLLVQSRLKTAIGPSMASIQNSPNYYGQGSVKSPNGDIDWIAIMMEDKPNVALVSGKLFDLDKGKTIVVLPQPDGSNTFVQLDEAVRSKGSLDIEDYFKALNGLEDFVGILK